MKRTAAIVTALFATAASLCAQSFAIDWFTIDGGGGTSTGGAYTLTGTIGQPDAGQMSGGNFTLSGGFWSAIIPVQQAGAPMLFIRHLGDGTAKIHWQPNTPGFVLQQTSSLDAATINWSGAPVAYTNGAIIPASPGMRYFRLVKPQ
jgi:hypothetical protein